jgi:antirestriction protein ArdC
MLTIKLLAQKIEDVAGIPTKTAVLPEGINGIYNMPIDMSSLKHECIYLPSFDTNFKAFRTFFHELSHATGMRLNRTMTYGSYEEEVIAEMSSKLLMQHFKLDTRFTDRLHSRYIESFSINLSSEQIKICKIKAKESFDFIINNWLLTTTI